MRDGVIQTENHLRVLAAVQELKRLQRVAGGAMLAVEGPTGRGKTVWSEWYFTQDSNCFYLEADENWTASWLLRDVAERLGLARAHTAETNKRAIMESQRQRQAQELPPLLLIIDEFDRVIKRRLLETVRGLHDRAGLSMILIGEAIWSSPESSLTRKSPRFADRVSQVVTFKDVTAGEVEACAREIYGLQLPDLERAAQIQQQAGGNFRRADKIIQELRKVMRTNPGEISEAKIRLAQKNLQIAEAREQKKRAAA